jgi:hypothetical protein
LAPWSRPFNNKRQAPFIRLLWQGTKSRRDMLAWLELRLAEIMSLVDTPPF